MIETIKCTLCGKEFEIEFKDDKEKEKFLKSKRNVLCSDCKHKRGIANTKHRDEVYNQIQLYVPKEEYKSTSIYKYSRQDIKDFAKSQRMSTNEFINKAVSEYIDNHKK